MANDDNVNDDVVDDDLYEYEDSQNATENIKFCKVYDSEDFFTVFVQLLLAFFALMSLWFKRQGEEPRRKFRTWVLDVSKQGVGACYAHVLNMVRKTNAMEQNRRNFLAAQPNKYCVRVSLSVDNSSHYC